MTYADKAPSEVAGEQDVAELPPVFELEPRSPTSIRGGERDPGNRRVSSVDGRPKEASCPRVHKRLAAGPHCPGGPDGVSRPPSAARHDAPLIGERAATRGRSAVGGAMSALREEALSVRATASRTGSNGGKVDTLGAARPSEAHSVDGAALPQFSRISVSRPDSAGFRRAHDAPLSGNAPQCASASEGGDEHAGGKRESPAPASRTGSSSGSVGPIEERKRVSIGQLTWSELTRTDQASQLLCRSGRVCDKPAHRDKRRLQHRTLRTFGPGGWWGPMNRRSGMAHAIALLSRRKQSFGSDFSEPGRRHGNGLQPQHFP